MIIECSQKPQLVYFKIRGHAQIIRSVLLEIGVEFDQIQVSKTGYLDPTIANNYGIEIQNLPYLIHNGNAIHQIFPIIKYLCIYFKRGDLLGKTIEDSIRISEILVKYMKQKNTTLSVLLQGLKQIQQKKLGQQALGKLSDVLTDIADKNKSCQATQKMFIKTGHYLCGYLTILDFIYYQMCFYFVNMLTVMKAPKGEICKKYVQFFESTQFYQRNKDFLEKYKIFIHEIEQQTNLLLQKMWVGDKKYLEAI